MRDIELAIKIDELAYDYDTYEYMDTVEDKDANVARIETMILKNKTESLEIFLNSVLKSSNDKKLKERSYGLLESIKCEREWKTYVKNIHEALIRTSSTFCPGLSKKEFVDNFYNKTKASSEK